MERSDGTALSADGVLTPPLSTDSSLQELIEAELRTRRATEVPQQQGEQEPEELMVVAADLKPSRFMVEQPESILTLEPEAPHASADVDSNLGVTRVTKITHSTETREVKEVSEVTEQVSKHDTEQVSDRLTEHVSEHTASHVTEQFTEQVAEQVTEQFTGQVTEQVAEQVTEQFTEQVTGQVTEQVKEKVTEQSTEITEHVKGQVTEQVTEHVMEQVTKQVVEQVTKQVVERHGTEKMDEEEERRPIEPCTESDGVELAAAAVTESRVVTDGGSGTSESSCSSSRRSSAGSDRPDTLSHEQVQEPGSAAEQMDVLSPGVADQVEVPPVSVGNDPEVCDESSDGRGETALPTEPQSSGCEEEKQVAQPVVQSTQAVADDVTDDVTGTAPVTEGVTVSSSVTDDVIVPAPVPDEGHNVIQSSKITDDDSDEGVGDGTGRREDAKDAKKLRRKKKSDTEEAGRRGSARPALDSEGDSDISSEGSSGASSLPRSQTSGVQPGRHRSSESSEGDHEDELGNVNLGQLRSSYLTNLDSAKPTSRTTRPPTTGVSIKNLKSSYTSQPAPAARTGTPGDGRPRDMSKITVNMASLKSVYSCPEGASPAVPPQKTTDLPAGLSLPSIRAAYVQQATGGSGGVGASAADAAAGHKPTTVTPAGIHTGVSIDKLRSSFGKEEATDHTRIHVRSFDSSKAIRRFSKDGVEAATCDCRSCGRRVFQMESMHAEGAVWHKNCFRCSQCSKHLSVDTYASHEGKLYCVVHHRQLLKPRAPAGATHTAPAATEPGPQSAAPDMVKGEEQLDSPPPAEVVRASSKADYGLDDLQNLNVKDRFSVFERTNEDDQEKTPTSVEVKRSQSILDKMKKFQGRGPARAADSADDTDGSGDEGRAPHDPDTVRSSTKKERPMSFSGLGDVKSRFEAGGRREPAPQDPAKGELAKLRGMICGAREHKLAYEEALREQEALSETRRSAVEPGLVAQVGNLRESYERAVQESESPRPSSREEAVVRGRAADMASRFEKAQLETENGHGATQNGATSSRELTPSGEDSLTSDSAAGQPPRADSADGDAAAQETAAPAPAPAAAADPDLPHTDTTKRMLDKFKQMEKNSGHTDEEMSPHREKAHGNARQMLSKYRQMQEQAQKEDLPDGPRPLKSFTPPPEEPVTSHEAEDAAEDADVAEDPDIVRASSKVHDEFLNKRTDQARSLRDKFESWAPQTERSFTLEEDCKPSLEITRNLRAKFESMKEQPKPAEKPQQHRASKFIIEPNQAAETCSTCNKRVYAMERLEVDKRILHKNCFRCSKCNCVLRMDTYTFNAGKLFCTPHFKQMFKTKGNYDEGFGLESRAKHWSSTSSHSDHSTMNGTTSAAPRPAEEVAETNGSANLDSGNMNGSGSPEPEPEQEQEQGQEGEEEETHQSYQRRDSASDDERVGASESEPEPEPEPKSEPELKLHPEPEPEPEPERGADVFQRVYESTVADGL